MGRGNNDVNHVYTIYVHQMDSRATTQDEPIVILEHHGSLTARAKRQITKAIMAGNVQLREKKNWLA